mgnify:CR=1 FL=1
MTNEVVAAETLTDKVANHLAASGGAVNQVTTWLTEKGVDFAIDLVIAVVILLVGWIVIRLVSAAVRKALMRGKAKGALIVNFICSVVTKGCWAILLVVVLARLGVDVGPIVAGLGVTGFILGFAFQESLGNLASGMMIALNEPFKVGDYISAAGNEGAVLEVNMMATVMATADNKKVVIPNKSVWGGPIVNFSALNIRRVDLQVGIAYGEDIKKAIEVIKAALESVPGVLKDPAPGVAVACLDASAVTINVRPWTKSGDYWDVANGGLTAVKEALGKAGIEIPFPQLVVHNAK